MNDSKTKQRINRRTQRNETMCREKYGNLSINELIYERTNLQLKQRFIDQKTAAFQIIVTLNVVLIEVLILHRLWHEPTLFDVRYVIAMALPIMIMSALFYWHYQHQLSQAWELKWLERQERVYHKNKNESSRKRD